MSVVLDAPPYSAGTGGKVTLDWRLVVKGSPYIGGQVRKGLHYAGKMPPLQMVEMIGVTVYISWSKTLLVRETPDNFWRNPGCETK